MCVVAGDSSWLRVVFGLVMDGERGCWVCGVLMVGLERFSGGGLFCSLRGGFCSGEWCFGVVGFFLRCAALRWRTTELFGGGYFVGLVKRGFCRLDWARNGIVGNSLYI